MASSWRGSAAVRLFSLSLPLLACAAPPRALGDAEEEATASGASGAPLAIELVSRDALLVPDAEGSAEALIGDVVGVEVTGLRPGATVALRATRGGYASSATFVAAADGTVDTRRDAAISGSYTGVDPDGPFWSLARSQPDTSLDLALPVTLSVADGRREARAALRFGVGEGIDLRRVDEAGVVAGLALPRSALATGALPGVIVLGGSEGGLPLDQAAFYALHGFAALAVGWYGLPGLPSDMDQVPIETVRRASDWLALQTGVDPERVGIVGTSRGSELALLAAAHLPNLRAAVGVVPSGVAWEGSTPATSSWTWGGAPVPYLVTHDEDASTVVVDGHDAERQRPMFEAALRDPAAVARAEIPVERIEGPVLLLGADDDGIWPSCVLAGVARDRLARSGHPFDDAYACYPAAGHGVGLPGAPTTDLVVEHPVAHAWVSLGGTPAGTAHAQRDAAARIVAFLHAALDRRTAEVTR